jgi:hypothetical protein
MAEHKNWTRAVIKLVMARASWLFDQGPKAFCASDDRTKYVPPDLDVHLVMDNYATHKTPLIRNWLARRPRWHVHLTPTSSS